MQLNANEDATLYRESTGIERDAEIEFSSAHRRRNGADTLKLTITDLGSDNAVGVGYDKELFAKEFTTWTSAWAVYDNSTDPIIAAFGNNVRFAFRTVTATGGRVPDKTEDNFLDEVHLGGGVGTAKRNTLGR